MNRKFVLTGAAALVAAGIVSAASAAPEPDRRGPGFERRIEARGLDRCERLKERLARVDRGFTAEQLRDIAQGRLAARDMTNLKVGKATEKDGVVTLEIVTKDGSLVETRQMSTKTGLDPNVGANCEQRVQRRDGDRGPGHRGPRGAMRGPAVGGLGNLPGGGGRNRDLDLSADDVKTLAEAALVLNGNERLKVGKVTSKDADTFSVDIVTQDNSLVVTREVNKHNGRWQRS